MSEKGLIARIHKELKILNSNRTNYQPVTQLINGKLTDNSLKKCINRQQTHEKMFNIPGHQENANQTTLRFHFTLIRIASINK
jgi:hypothetical protein